MAEQKIIAVIGSTGAQGGGLVRAILADPERRFAVRAITRKPDSDKARALAAAGAEVVAGDADEPASLERAFAGAHGAFLVTNFWEHFSPERFGIAGDVLSGAEYAAAFSRHLGTPVSFYDMPFNDYRALGFPGADDMGNMYEHHAILGEAFRRHRSPEVARALNPALQSFDAWLSANASRIPLG